MDFTQVRDLCARSLVSERDINDAVVRKRGHGGNRGALLSTTGSCSGDEYTCVLAPKCARCPELSCGIPEGLPLCWEVAITSWNTNQECVIGREDIGCDFGHVWLGWSMHLRQDFRGEGLGDPTGKISSIAREVVVVIPYW